ncbi:MAG TPA: aminotransferase class IV [Opitutaceae bacterium]|nr:aminotransferase class IV [Opitutaceae bacterium]
MNTLVDLNGAILPIEQTAFGQLAPAFAFPRGLFETVRLIEGRPVFFAAHYERLGKSAAKLGFALTSSEAELRERIRKLAQATSEQNGNVRLMLFDDDGCGVSELIVARHHPYTSAQYKLGFRLLTMIDARGSEGEGHKKTNYEKNRVGRAKAQENGFDEALFVSETGQLFEGAVSNLFLVKDGTLSTPRLRDEVLPGVARRQILERSGLPVMEGILTREMLHNADEVFVTNVLLGIMPVSRVDEAVYPIENYTVAPSLTHAFQQWQKESIS